MKTNTASIVVVVTVLLACVVQARYTDDDLDRNKRQLADAKASEYLALIRLGLASGCREIACGLIDIHARYNKIFVKRSWSDQRFADYQARIALLQGQPILSHGLFDPFKIFVKRTSSDQRIAELQALIALSRGSGIVGHGRIDPFGIGRRKRDTGILSNIINRNRLFQNLEKDSDVNQL